MILPNPFGNTERTITDRKTLLKELEQVRDSSGTLVAVLSLNGPRYRFGRDRIPEALQEMQLTVDHLTDMIWQDAALD